MNQEEFDRIKEAERAAFERIQEAEAERAAFERIQEAEAERAAQEGAQQQAQQRLNDYQVWQNYVPNGLSGAASGAAAQQINISLENERAFRAQALSLAIDFHRTNGDEVDIIERRRRSSSPF